MKKFSKTRAHNSTLKLQIYFLTLTHRNQIPDLDDFSESSSISNLADDHRTISKIHLGCSDHN